MIKATETNAEAASASPREQWMRMHAALWGQYDPGVHGDACLHIARNPREGSGRFFGPVAVVAADDPRGAWDVIERTDADATTSETYMTVNLLRPEAGLSRKRSDVALVTALVLDLDTAEPGETIHKPVKGGLPHPTRAEADSMLVASPFGAPTVLVDSGHGVHAYWVLVEPLSGDMDQIKETVLTPWGEWWRSEGEARGFHVDTKRSVDPASVLRPAGAINRKTDDGDVAAMGDRHGVPVTLIVAEPGRLYDADDLLALAFREPVYDVAADVQPGTSDFDAAEAPAASASDGVRPGDRLDASPGAVEAMLELLGLRESRSQRGRWTYPREDGTYSRTDTHVQVFAETKAGRPAACFFGDRVCADFGLEANAEKGAFWMLAERACGGDYSLAARVVMQAAGDPIDLDALFEAVDGKSADDLEVAYPKAVEAAASCEVTACDSNLAVVLEGAANPEAALIFQNLPNYLDADGWALRWALLDSDRFLWSGPAGCDAAHAEWHAWTGALWVAVGDVGEVSIRSSLNLVADAIEHYEAPARVEAAVASAEKRARDARMSDDDVAKEAAKARCAAVSTARAWTTNLRTRQGLIAARDQMLSVSAKARRAAGREVVRQVSRDVWDRDPHLLAFASPVGVFDLRAGKRLDYDPKSLQSRAVPRPFKDGDAWEKVIDRGLTDIEAGTPLALAPQLRRDLERWGKTDQEIPEYVQRLAGFAVWGAPGGVIASIMGAGGTGKSTIFGALANALGGDLATKTKASAFGVDRDGAGANSAIADLRETRMWLIDDASSDGDGNTREVVVMDASRLKSYSEGGALVGRDLQEKQKDARYTAKGTLFVFSQYPPVLNDVDDAVMRRLCPVWLGQESVIPKKDPEAAAWYASAEGLAWVLLWAIEGCVKVRREHSRRAAESPDGVASLIDCLCAPRATEDWKAEFKEKTNVLSPFFDAVYLRDPDAVPRTSEEVLADYEAWAETKMVTARGMSTGFKPLAGNTILKHMKALTRSDRIRVYVDGRETKTTVYFAIRPKKKAEADAERRALHAAIGRGDGNRATASIVASPQPSSHPVIDYADEDVPF